MEFFQDRTDVQVALVVSNKPKAGVLDIAREFDVPTHTITRDELQTANALSPILQQHQIDGIVLAGFLLLVPQWLVQLYPNKIINIHPALLPKYGGKGMYGHHVHQAVKDNKETESGITIHYVNEQYDEGNIIFQATCALNPTDTPQTIAAKVLALEHRHFPQVIAQVFG